MANSTAANGSGVKTLTATQPDTVTLSVDHAYIEVTNWDTTNRISFTVNGTTPAVDAAEMFIVGPGQSLTVPAFSADVVKLISAGAAAYSVQGVDA